MERRLTLVSAILVTWNSARDLRRCLDCLAAQTHRELELIHVDNASEDDSLSIVRGFTGVAHSIVNSANVGFAAAVNQGVRVAKGELIQLVNPDAFLEPEYIARLADAIRADERVGMATGTLIQAETGRIDSRGIRMTRSGRHLDIDQGREPRAAGRGPEIVFGVSGAAAMYSRAFVDDVTIGGEFLDEDFFAFREDADVAWRGQLFGWGAIHVPDAVALHVRTVTPERRRSLSPAINMHGVKNRFLLRLKNEGAYLALRNAPFEIARDLVVIAATLTVERSSLPALAWLWKNRRRIMAKRRVIQSRRRVPDRALARWFV